jgi:4-hydroxy-tetrahydrodipicolinate reductase
LIRVAVAGAAGRMGQEVVRTVEAADDLDLAAMVDRVAGFAPDLAAVLAASPADVLVDFTHHSSVLPNARTAIAAGVSPVIGATGASQEDLAEINRLARDAGIGAIYAPNFAIGAVLMMHFAELAARWLPDAEIIELHHPQKVDAPSGTAMLTAQKIAAARTRPPGELPETHFKAEGARGGSVDGVPVHSVRLPGLVAHQQVIFGGTGEVLTIQHDSLDRSSFMEGVKLCIRRVPGLRGLTVGMDSLLFG